MVPLAINLLQIHSILLKTAEKFRVIGRGTKKFAFNG